MSSTALLSRLDGVRQTSPGRWVACCPAHDDRHPSMTIRELDDGRVLMHCFAGCDVGEILGAVGLGFDALFPERPLGHRVSRERRPFNPSDILQCVAGEALIVALVARDIAMGAEPSQEDCDRILTASARLDAATEVMRYA